MSRLRGPEPLRGRRTDYSTQHAQEGRLRPGPLPAADSAGAAASRTEVSLQPVTFSQ